MSSSSTPSGFVHRAPLIEDLLRREGGIQLSRNGGPVSRRLPRRRGERHAGAGRRRADRGATLGQVDFAGIVSRRSAHRDPARPKSSLYGADAVGESSRSSRDAAAHRT
jgi:hypothetical protein